MSGGVDSSVAAALLKQQGYEVIGITMNLSCSSGASNRGCCSISAASDAQKVADQLNIRHYILNFKEEFKKQVIDNFVEEYKNGRTPNPCVRCNQFIKFDLLLKKAEELGAEYMATGHYARISQGGEGYKLLKGKDPKKDQSYVLYRMTQKQLAHTLFPLRDLTKEKVRKIAKELKLPVADKEESQEICFVEDDDYGRFLKEKVPEAVRPGPILDRNGKEVGRHEGIAFYTIGQRSGIGAHGRKKYVVDLNVRKNAVIIGDNSDLLKLELTASRVNYLSGRAPAKKLEISAKIRYNSPAAAAELSLLKGGKVKVLFKEPQRAITPGQSVVFYQGDEVLGGGIIEKGGK